MASESSQHVSHEKKKSRSGAGNGGREAKKGEKGLVDPLSKKVAIYTSLLNKMSGFW